MEKDSENTSESNLNKDIKEENTLPISDDIKSILDDPDIPKEKKEKLIKALGIITLTKTVSFSGPIPPPEILEKYNKVTPNGGERIMQMAEKQLEHRTHLEDYVIKEELNQSKRGQIFGFVLAIVVLLFVLILSILGHEMVASILGGTTMIGLVAVFVIGKKLQQKDLKSKK
jgi:uncharacterized membrane protein